MIYDLGGTIRACTPEQTLNKLRPMLQDVFGITRVADVTGLDFVGIPVSVCIRPNSRILSASQGKGITTELAQISAIMESIEAWHAERITGELVYSSYHELAKSHALPSLERLMRSFISYPNVFSQEFAWLQGMDIMQQQPAFIPYSLISLNTTANCPGRELFVGTSNGLAGGNTREEAICHGFYESIERDCIAAFERLTVEEKALRRVRIDSIDSAHNQELIKRVHSADLRLYLFEITNRFNISSFSAIVDDYHTLRNLGYFGGHGTHLSREVALSRAICEAVQSRLTYISGSRDDVMPQVYYRPPAQQPAYDDREILEFSQCHNDVVPDNFSDCITVLLSRMQQQSIQHVLFYDHTRPELGIPVINIIIPELDFEWKAHRMSGL